MRRPTRSAWLVNILARAEPERMTELLELGTALQQAQQRMAGDDLRRLSKERRTLIDSLSRRAGELGAEQEYAATDAAIQEVSQTLQAALGDPAVADLVRAGRMPQAVSYGGFGPADLTSALAASLPAAEPKTTPAAAGTGLRRGQSRRRAAAGHGRGQGGRAGGRSQAAGRRSRRRRRPPRPSRRRRRLPPEPTNWPMRSSRCGPGCGKPKIRNAPPGKRRGRRGSARRSSAAKPRPPRRMPPRRPRGSISSAIPDPPDRRPVTHDRRESIMRSGRKAVRACTVRGLVQIGPRKEAGWLTRPHVGRRWFSTPSRSPTTSGTR